MIRISQIKLDISEKDIYTALAYKAAGKLRISRDRIKALRIVRHSIDARHKPVVFHVYTVDIETDNEERVLRACRCRQASIFEAGSYMWPDGVPPVKRPVIIGMGPAGLFAGYMLAEAGCYPIICDRGRRVEDRKRDVETFWDTGRLNEESNVQFGEGGAGAFSDGKLNTLVNDRYGRNDKVLRIFADNGADESILYESKPHIGTDKLSIIVASMRKRMQQNGATFLYEHKLTDIEGTDDGGIAARFENGTEISTRALVLAIGHSARDTFDMLYKKGVPMAAKAFAVGLRVLHPQYMIDAASYGEENIGLLPAASYKLTHRSGSGRGVYSFCMCPGGYVVNASSEAGYMAVNGMSYSDRSGAMANSGIIVSVDPDDYGDTSPLAGITYQRMLEDKAYVMGHDRIPVQYYTDYRDRSSHTHDQTDIIKGFKGGIDMTDMSDLLPDVLRESFIEGMEHFNKVINGFAGDKALLAGIESRTSSPVRIHRDGSGRSAFGALYPCGEGAGYAGGIMSAAMDGIYIAEEIWKNPMT